MDNEIKRIIERIKHEEHNVKLAKKAIRRQEKAIEELKAQLPIIHYCYSSDTPLICAGDEIFCRQYLQNKHPNGEWASYQFVPKGNLPGQWGVISVLETITPLDSELWNDCQEWIKANKQN